MLFKFCCLVLNPSRAELEDQLQNQKTSMKFANEKIDSLVEELEEARRKLVLSEEGRSQTQSEASQAERQLQEVRVQLEAVIKARREMQEELKAKESAIQELRVRLSELEASMRAGEEREEGLRRELAEMLAEASHS